MFRASTWFHTIPVIGHVPAECALLEDGGHPRLVGEEEGQVRGQYAVLHVPQHLQNQIPFYPGGCNFHNLQVE